MVNRLEKDPVPQLSLEQLRHKVVVPAYPIHIAPDMVYERFSRSITIDSPHSVSLSPLWIAQSRLLEILLYFSGQTVSVSTLINNGFQHSRSDDNTIANTVCHLRNQIGDSGKMMLININSQGYKWAFENINKQSMKPYFRREEIAPNTWYDFYNRGLRVPGQLVRLAPGLSLLMELFISNPNYRFSKSDFAKLYFQTNNTNRLEEDAINTLLARFRRQLKQMTPESTDLLNTTKIEGVGRYSLNRLASNTIVCFPQIS